MKIRVNRIIKKTKAEGPGVRYCIWFQGCSRHCKGCWARETWSFEAGKEYDVDEIIEDILSTKGIEGVTFLGGEPFEQTEALEIIASKVQHAGMSVVCFTGFRLEEIKTQNCLKYIDLLIDGEFRDNEKDYSRPWVGSKNQRYHFFTERYNENILKSKNKIEVRVQKNGLILFNGMGDFKKLKQKIDMIVKH
ncbi:radical SAM protein [bacterium]|nr:radical SAM protein [bacterium]